MIGKQTVVYTSGTFDMLHINHLRMIEYEAKDTGSGQDGQNQQGGDMPEEFDGGW